MRYLAVSIGIPDEADAHRLSRTLVEERIAAGTRISSGRSHYRWDGSVTGRTSWTITGFTTAAQLDRLYDLVEDYSDDDLPGVTYREIAASSEHFQWIDSQTA